MNSTKKILLIVLGSISIGLGIIGMFLPVMPTTIFLIIGSWCYVRSSEQLYNWLHNHSVLGIYLRAAKDKSMPLRAKITTLVLLWASLIFSASIIDKLWVQLILLATGIGVTLFITRLKTLKFE
jgi:uncharacterized protein